MSFDTLSKQFAASPRHDCALRTASAGQKIFYAALATGLLFLLFYRWDIFIFLLSGYMMTLYFLSGVQKSFAGFAGLWGGVEHVSREELATLSGDALPVYSIFLPLYHEAAVLDRLLDGIAALDYPQDKLDVKLLLECDDDETRGALERRTLPACCEVLTAPPEQPRTKPRACNYALEKARGEFCVIYDAEDRPEPDQLKRAVAAFRRDTSGKIVCLQARLGYYNTRQNLLTRLFTLEYATTFSLFLPGLSKLGAPLPLGGTSNHFRTAVLRELGGWDPFNVTEDCDLGMRIGHKLHRTKMLDSTTYEEANSRIGNFLRQRSRWVKGFLQTHLVYARAPRFVLKNFGVWGALQAYLTVGGSVLMMLSNLVCWGLLSLYCALLYCGTRAGLSVTEQIVGPLPPEKIVFGPHAWPIVFLGPGETPFWSNLSVAFGTVSLFLLFANALLLLIAALAALKTRRYALLWVVPLLPAYWFLISLGAWKGAYQLFSKPFYWEKTTHGLGDVIK